MEGGVSIMETLSNLPPAGHKWSLCVIMFAMACICKGKANTPILDQVKVNWDQLRISNTLTPKQIFAETGSTLPMFQLEAFHWWPLKKLKDTLF